MQNSSGLADYQLPNDGNNWSLQIMKNKKIKKKKALEECLVVGRDLDLVGTNNHVLRKVQ